MDDLKPALKGQYHAALDMLKGAIEECPIDTQIDKIDLSAPESGFDWYKIQKLDHILLNLRHIQEHAGQLRDRLLEAGVDQKWVTRSHR